MLKNRVLSFFGGGPSFSSVGRKGRGRLILRLHAYINNVLMSPNVKFTLNHFENLAVFEKVSNFALAFRK